MSILRMFYFSVCIFIPQFWIFRTCRGSSRNSRKSIFINFVTELLLEGHITNVEEELNRLTAADWSNDIS